MKGRTLKNDLGFAVAALATLLPGSGFRRRLFFSGLVIGFALSFGVSVGFSQTSPDTGTRSEVTQGTFNPQQWQQANGAEALHDLTLALQTIKAHLTAKELQRIQSYDAVINKALGFLVQRPEMAAKGKEQELQTAMNLFARRLRRVRDAALNADQAQAEKEFRGLPATWKKVKELYPADLLRTVAGLSERHACPVHPEVLGRKNEYCSKCGLLLERAEAFCGIAVTQPILKASIQAEQPLMPGKMSEVKLRLTSKNGSPVQPSDLLVAHTERIHLFLIDPSLTDYHHAHPRATANAGEYVFTFTPAKSASYRLWADLLPTASRRQEYAVLDLGKATNQEVAIDRTVKLNATVEGWKFQLSFNQTPLRTGRPIFGKLRVTDSDGVACARLEPLMATFAHLVGFHEDFKTIMHIHPAGLELQDRNLRGGPEVEFYLQSSAPGFIRLFAQVQIDGKIRTAPFGLLINP